MLLALALRNGVRLPYADAAALRRAYTFDNLQSFLDLYYLGLTVLQTGDDFYQMTEAYLARAAHENVRHAEVFISPQAHLRRGLPIAPIIENILAAFDAAYNAHGVTGGLIAGIQRQFDEADALARLAEERTPLTVCPCSNVALRVFPDMRSHNICKLHASSVCVTINSDDPPYFGGYINKNYAAVQAALGITEEDLWQMARNSFISAYMSEELRIRYLSELDRYRPKPG